MNDAAGVEQISPAAVQEGDVIEDPRGNRWITVTEVQVLGSAESGGGGGQDGRVFNFFAGEPDDRVSFEEAETVHRRRSGG